MEKLAIVLLSAGMDSAVCASIAQKEHTLAFLHFQYGQRTAQKELECFLRLCEYFQPEKKLIVNLEFFKEIGGSSLIDKNLSIPEREELGIPSTYVPFRNGIFLSIAAAWAEVIGAKKIFIGVNQVDFSGYPDCRDSFIKAFNKAVEEGTKPETHIQIETPLLFLNKRDIITIGLKLNTPFHLTWSCYKSAEKACGKCPSCRLRLKAFQEIRVKDPISYEEC